MGIVREKMEFYYKKVRSLPGEMEVLHARVKKKG
jgi:hypothetical protein